MTYVALSTRVALLAIFAVSSVAKLGGRRRYAAFAASVHAFVPARAVGAVAVLVVVTEVICVALLAWPAAGSAGPVLAALTLTAFTVAGGWAVRTGRRAACLCLGTTAKPMDARHVVRNALMLMVAVVSVFASLGAPSTVHPAGATVAAAVGVVSAAILARFDDLVALMGDGTVP
jgi:hypothetical protein